MERPRYLFNNFTFRSQLNIRTTRVSYQTLFLPNCKTETFKKSFVYSAANFWNELPELIRELPSQALFSMKLYKYLISQKQ